MNMEKTNTNLTDMQAKEKKTILVVDDSDMVCFLIESILENYYNVVIKNDGSEALTYLNQGNRPNLILLDMMMPEMNGRTFVRRVYGDPRYGNIPIIFVTTVESAMLVNSFTNMGVVDYIVKPFENNDLLQRVDNVLNKK